MYDFQFFDQDAIRASFQREFELTNQRRSILHTAKNIRQQIARERRAAAKAIGEEAVQRNIVS